MLKILSLLFLVSCAQLEKSPPRDKHHRMYKLKRDFPGIIYSRRCADSQRENRDCEVTEYDLMMEWNEFSDADSVLIKSEYVYP